MNTSHRAIMYIGTKPRKDDRPNNILNRVWHGPGAVVDGIPAVQASKLMQHPDEFVDVTGFSAEQIEARAAKAVADAEERRRKSRSAIAHQAGGVLLEYASEEEILAELERRNRLEALRKEVGADAPASGAAPTVDKRDSRALQAAVESAIDAILEANDPSKLDESGIPTREAVQEVVGIPLTEDEYKAALGISEPLGADDKNAEEND